MRKSATSGADDGDCAGCHQKNIQSAVPRDGTYRRLPVSCHGCCGGNTTLSHTYTGSAR
ncbi:hypothetical protein EI94DRAFT_1734774, partial [Lactarius quietus]